MKIAELYQDIAITVIEIIPEEWSKVFIYAEVQEDVGKSSFCS
ncbi:immunity protein YezG family protein [Paenibacillus polymyxa]|nr:immunity protein YezG family protein [Paenibacillus polymyxa]